MPKKLQDNNEAESHGDLKGFNMSIDEFGQMKSSLSIDKLNDFLNKNVEDKKLSEASREEE